MELKSMLQKRCHDRKMWTESASRLNESRFIKVFFEEVKKFTSASRIFFMIYENPRKPQKQLFLFQWNTRTLHNDNSIFLGKTLENN